MPQVKSLITLPKDESIFDKAISQEFRNFVLDLANILNKGVRFADNFDMNILSVTDTGTANSENTVNHTLRRVPLGYIVISRTSAGVIYNGSTAWTVDDIFIKSTTANNNIKLLLF